MCFEPKNPRWLGGGEEVLQVFNHLLAHPGLSAKHRSTLEQAVVGVYKLRVGGVV
jgi:hypothetical protein